MPDNLPLLIFPRPVSIIPPKGRGFRPSSSPLPGRSRQSERLDPQIDRVREEFSRFKGLVDVTMAGGEQESNPARPPVCFHGQRRGNEGTALALGQVEGRKEMPDLLKKQLF